MKGMPYRFQSSADPKIACNGPRRINMLLARLFQSSADPKIGCNKANPQRFWIAFAKFQSSAGPKIGCNGPIL
jgi:hypothetical protein